MTQLKDLNPNPRNPRSIPAGKLKLLKKALVEFGDLGGFVFNTKTKQMVGGHQRLKVMPPGAEVVIEKVYKKPTRTGTVREGHVLFEGEKFSYREVEWDSHREMAANIAANRGAGDWDFPELTKWMSELSDAEFDLDLTMWGESERDEFLDFDLSDSVRNEKEDEIPTLPKKAKTVLGDLYELGEHRLFCGDSTRLDHVEKLMTGEKADMCFTSPPYNLGENAVLRKDCGTGKKSAYIEKTDHRSEEDYFEFLKNFTDCAIQVADTVFVNVQLLAGNKFVIPRYWNFYSDHLIDLMCWDKEHGVPCLAPRVLNTAFELIFIFSGEDRPTRSMKHGPKFQGTIPNIYRLNPNGKKDELAKEHGAVFPVQFAEFFVSHFSDEKVYDPFGGSGTTLIACEKLKRKCFTMEIDPHYCDVIVARWEKYTGMKAKKVTTPVIRKRKAE